MININIHTDQLCLKMQVIRWHFSHYRALFPCCPPAPQIGEVRDKPIVSYVGDSAVIACKMEEKKPKPNTWNWYKANGTDKVCEQLRDFVRVVVRFDT